MRKLKFRIWDKNQSKFVQIKDNGDSLSDFYITLDGRLCYNKSIDYHENNGIYGLLGEEENYTIQQFTGLLDKNGKEIYEGDILKVGVFGDWIDVDKHYYNKEVKFEIKESGDTTLAGFLYIPEDREIIGNSLENPELLK